jgi:hypothetical protein
VNRLIADLGDEDFDKREKATRELRALGDAVELRLRQALDRNPSAENRRRIEDLLARLDEAAPSGEALRALRAIEVLEHIGTPEASRLLKALADGAPEARLTREAKAALQRLEKRSGTTSLRK